MLFKHVVSHGVLSLLLDFVHGPRNVVRVGEILREEIQGMKDPRLVLDDAVGGGEELSGVVILHDIKPRKGMLSDMYEVTVLVRDVVTLKPAGDEVGERDVTTPERFRVEVFRILTARA